MRAVRATVAAAVLALCPAVVAAVPLDSGDWYQIARMSDSDSGMFDGNGAFDPNYIYGTYISPLQTEDFHRSFEVYSGMKILFITGDQSVWGIADYGELWSLIDARAGEFAPNLTFDAHFGGTDQVVEGNVLSRSWALEDPWITLMGDHFSGSAASLMLWGEVDYNYHNTLKNTRGGVNVFVSLEENLAAVPLPAGLSLLMAALGSFGFLGLVKRRRKSAAAGL